MKKTLLLIAVAFISLQSIGQSKIAFYGYVKDLGMYYQPGSPLAIDENTTLNNLILNQIHNRLNFRWYISDHFTLASEARNRIYFGQMVREFPDYKSAVDIDNGFVDLSTIVGSGNGWFMHSMLDRVWLDYTRGKWQIRVGRQRINWGLNLVWNPNDIFNTFSYFDFDYEERPGTDAVKIQYYTSVTSSAQLVYKLGRNKKETAFAGMYRFSKLNYDFQILSGKVGKDYILGGGWAGDIKGGGFRGEWSYFLPTEKNNGSEEAFVASVSGDYTLQNSLYFHGGVLFNSIGAKGKAGGRSFFEQQLSAKMLSLAMYNVFLQSSFPITPLFSANFSAMINPLDGSSFIGPSLVYSLANNWEIMVNGQLFFGETGTEYGDYGKAIFGRLKWAF